MEKMDKYDDEITLKRFKHKIKIGNYYLHRRLTNNSFIISMTTYTFHRCKLICKETTIEQYEKNLGKFIEFFRAWISWMICS